MQAGVNHRFRRGARPSPALAGGVLAGRAV